MPVSSRTSLCHIALGLLLANALKNRTLLNPACLRSAIIPFSSQTVHSQMIPLTRRRVLHALSASTAGLFLSQYKAAACVSVPASLSTASLAPVGPGTPYRGRLPLKTVFVGSEKFQLLCAKAKKENWGALPL